MLRHTGGRPQHVRAADRVDRQHRHAQRGRAFDRLGDRVGDVMKFQVEKTAVAARVQKFHHLGADSGKQLAADLVGFHGIAKALDQRGSLLETIYIQRNDKL